MTEESSGWSDYEESITEPVPLPSFYDIARCWKCREFSGFFLHHVRLSQYNVTMIQCGHCCRYTRVSLRYPDRDSVHRRVPRFQYDESTGYEAK